MEKHRHFYASLGICVLAMAIIGYLVWCAIQKGIDGVIFASGVGAIGAIAGGLAGFRIRDVLGK